MVRVSDGTSFCRVGGRAEGRAGGPEGRLAGGPAGGHKGQLASWVGTCVRHMCTHAPVFGTCAYMHLCSAYTHLPSAHVPTCICVRHTCTCLRHMCTCLWHVNTCLQHMCTCLWYISTFRQASHDDLGVSGCCGACLPTAPHPPAAHSHARPPVRPPACLLVPSLFACLSSMSLSAWAGDLAWRWLSHKV